MRGLVAALVGVLLLAGCGGSSATAQDGPLLVAAASDLQPAFTELGEVYAERTGRQVTFTFGSSGQLAQQLENGAPYDVFASASVRYVEQVLAAGRGDPSTQQDYAYGRLAVWTRGSQAVTLEQLADPRLRRIAIANPEHAPYGLAAEQALATAGIDVQDRLVLGESVTDALRLASSGNADVAVVALSLATAREDGVLRPVPADAHEPLRQSLVITADEGRTPAARSFTDLVASADGRAVLQRHGFTLPDAVPAG